MTAKQLSFQTGLQLDSCSYVLWELSVYELVYCLNNQTRKSRLYWLTELGKKCRGKVSDHLALALVTNELPEIDWNLYGWVCFTHRAAVIKALHSPMQPVRIVTTARFKDPQIRMSANNVRDVIKRFLEEEIVQKVPGPRKRSHPCYSLTATGLKLQALLLRAEEKPT
ncbi:MAG: hypothetical protein O7D91_21150 [Planctomycetota bacterium]|nr:hypothetical protein [Planctomycetota bacterium]